MVRRAKHAGQSLSKFHLETLEKRILFSADAALSALEVLSEPASELAILQQTHAVVLATEDETQERETQTKELIIVDSTLPDFQTLLAELSSTSNIQPQVVVLDTQTDALQQLSTILDGQDGLTTLHLMSNSSSGSLELAGQQIDTLDLLTAAEELYNWRSAFAPEADLLLYGCELSTEGEGRHFVDTLARLTGADVSTSSVLMGDVEQSVGLIAAQDQRNSESPIQAASRQKVTAVDELVFIDTDVYNFQELLEDLQSRANGERQFDVFVLDNSLDGVEQISTILSGYDSLDAVHILSHGVDGAIDLGATRLDAERLSASTAQIAAWSNAFDVKGDLLIYGCDLASTIEGQRFVDDLARITGTDVAASIDDTGHRQLGGDWELEYHKGEVEKPIATSPDLQQRWRGVLADISSNMVGHYQFEETSGLFAIDATGNADGSLLNSPSRVNVGAVGDRALDFSGDGSASNAYVQINNNSAQDFGTGSWSVSFWYNLSSAPTADVHLVGDHDGQAGSSGFRVYATNTGQIQIQIGDGLSSSTLQTVGVFDGSWQHVTYTYDSASTTGTIYTNAGSGSGNNVPNYNVNSNSALTIGAVDTSNSDFDGKIDDVRLYTRALTSSDVTDLYATKTPDITTGLILHNTFDIDASDSSVNSYNGEPEEGAYIDTAVGTNKIGDGKLSLNGNISHVDISAHVEHFDNLTQGTIAAWVYLDSLSDEYIIFNSSDRDDNDSRLTVSIFNRDVNLFVKEGGSRIVDAVTITPITADTWTHIAVTVDSTGNAIYVNGIEQALNYIRGTASSSAFLNDVNDLDYMGWGIDISRGNYFYGAFDGFIDDGRVYDRALNSADIMELYNLAGPQSYTVTNTLDDGSTGSLRWAITQANARTGADTIDFDIAGSGTQVISLGSALPEITDEVFIDGTTQTGWAEQTFMPVVLDGNDLSRGFELSIGSDGSEIRGLVIRDFSDEAIFVDSQNNLIAGNWLGQFNSDGSDAGIAEAITGYGITSWDNGSNNAVGGTTSTDRNVILTESSSSGGVYVYNVDNWMIFGNYFGTDIAGNARLSSTIDAGNGIVTSNGAVGITVGGTTDAHRNVFAGLRNGIQFLDFTASANFVYNNWFGLGADGTTVLGNNISGVSLSDVHHTVIGGTGGLGNVFVGSSQWYAISADYSNEGTVIQGNTIGQNESGSVVAGNYGGIYVDNVRGARDVTIGGIAAGEGNVIRGSKNHGIVVYDDESAVSIRGNRIFDNDLAGIDLNGDGFTLNDAGDSDSGPNELQNWAVINSVSIADDQTFTYNLDTTTLATGTYSVDFYASNSRDGGQVEGERYLGTITDVSAGNALLIDTLPGVTLTPGEYITLITTDSSGNSSEFSNYAVATRADSGGAVPNGLQATAATEGGLSVNSDGGNDIVLISDTSLFNGDSAATIEVAFSIDTPASDMTTLFSYAQGTDSDELFLGIDSTGELFFRTSSDGSSSASSITKHLDLLDGQRHQVSVTWENVTGDVIFYVDGEAVQTHNGYQQSSTIETGGSLAIGQHQLSQDGPYDADDTFAGTLHDVRVFNDVRTASEISASSSSALPYNESGMIANWRFDDLSTDGVVTEAVSGNNLTVRHVLEAGFTPSEALLTLNIDENSDNGTVVGKVAGVDAEREAQIASLMAANPDLIYSAETGKFYKAVLSSADFATATANAAINTLYGEAGQLASIRSAAEQKILGEMVASGGSPLWIGASDATVEGEWSWQDASGDDDQFWQGDETGYNPQNAYENWMSGKPDSGTGNEDGLLLNTDGTWDDSQTSVSYGYMVEWNADSVLDANQALTYSITVQTATGAFDIDADTGEIRVLEGSLLDADTLDTHILTITVSDTYAPTPNTYTEDFTISLNNLVEINQSMPEPQSVNENTDLIFSITNGNAVSVDDTVAGTDSAMQVSLSVNDGILTLSQTTGLTFVEGNNGSRSIVVSGAESDINAALDGMAFTPNANFSGSVALIMATELVADQAQSNDSVLITVNAVNQAPLFAIPGEAIVTDAQSGYLQNQDTLVLSDGSMIVTPYNSSYKSLLMKLNADGSLDTTFGASGYIDNASISFIQSLIEQVDGKILVSATSMSSDIFLARYNADGTIDESFGSGGMTTITSGTHDQATGLAIQSDGSIVLVGAYNNDSTIMRFSSTGILDSGFGNSGITTLNLSNRSEKLEAVSVLADGSIVAVGQTHVLKLDSAGSLDGSFGTAGILDLGDKTRGIEVQSDGKFVVAGGDGAHLFATRFNADGSIDTGFGAAGAASWSTMTATAYSVAQQADGKLVVAGFTDVYPDSRWFVIRFNLDGTLDADFGDNGAWVNSASNGEAFAVSLYNDGNSEKIVIGGFTVRDSFANGDTYSTVARLDSDGSIDSTLRTNTLDGNPTFVENGTAVVLDSNVLIYDVELSDGDDFDGATLTLERTGGASSNDVFSTSENLSFDGATTGNINLSPTGVVGTYTNTGGSLVLSFASGVTNDQVNEVISSIAYSNINDTPPGSVELEWTFSDGNSGVQGPGGALSSIANSTVNIVAVNDTPALTSIEATALAYSENDDAMVVTSTLAVTDVDSTDIESANVRITGNYINGEDELAFTDLNNISGSWNAGSGELTLTGTATVAQYQTALRTVTYVNTSDDPSTATRTISFVVDDAYGQSDTQTRDIRLTAINDIPTITNLNSDTLLYNEGDGAVVIDQLANALVADIDSNDFNTGTLTVSLMSGGVNPEDVLAIVNQGAGAGQIGVSGSDVTYEGVVIGTVSGGSSGADLVVTFDSDANATAVSALVQVITFENTENATPTTGDRTVRFILTDGDGGISVNHDTTVTVNAINDAPVILSNGGGAFASLSISENQAVVTTVSSSDIDGDTPLYAVIGGVDANSFAIDGSSGELSFVGAPDFETPGDTNADNTYDVIVQVSDRVGGIDSQRIAVTVTEVNEPPELDLSNGSTSGVLTAVGSEAIVNTTTANHQTLSGNARTVGIDDAGNYVVIWTSKGQDQGSTLGVYGQRYDSSGVAQGGEFLVNTTVSGEQQQAVVAMADDGRFVVVWSGEGVGDAKGIFGQRYNAAGVAQGGEFRINTISSSFGMEYPSVAMGDDGRFVVAWQDRSSSTIYAREYDSTGVARGSEIAVANNHGSFFNQQVQTAMNASGEFVVVWVDNRFEISAQRYNGLGMAQGSVFQTNEYTVSQKLAPSVALRDSGEFVVSWSSRSQDADGEGVYARLFDSNGMALGGEFMVNETEIGNQEQSSVAFDASGAFTVIWSDTGLDGSGSGIYARQFDASGVAIGGETGVTTTVTGSQDNGSIAISDSGAVIVAWESTGQDGDGESVVAQRFDIQSEDHAATFIEGGSPVAIADIGSRLADDSGILTSLTVTLTNRPDADLESLVFDVTGTSISGAYVSGTGVLSLTGNDTVANYEQVLGTISYQNLSLAPDPMVRIVEVLASDGILDSELRTTKISIALRNDAPTFTSSAITAATEDVEYSYEVATADVDTGDTRTITASTLPGWLRLEDNGDGTALLIGTPANAHVGLHTIVLEVDDGEAPAVNQSFTITVTNTNDAPTFTSSAYTLATEDVEYSYDVTTADVDTGDTRTITASTLPGWLRLEDNGDGTALLIGTPANAHVGLHNIVLEVDDGTAPAVTQSFTITVTNTNDAPTFTSSANTLATEDVEYSYDVTTVDVDTGDTRTITASTLPGWLRLEDNGDGTALLIGTPPNAYVGPNDVVLEVNDGTAPAVTQSFTITVTNTNDAPTFTSSAITAATEDVEYSYDITTEDVDTGDTRTISASTLPSWLRLDDHGDGTASLTGTPARAHVGLHSIVLEVDDGEAPAITHQFTIIVGKANDAPTFTSSEVTAATEDVRYSYDIITADVDTDDTRTINASTLPGWLRLEDNGDGTALLTGTPANADVGLHGVVLEVDDGEAPAVTQSFTITVANTNDAPTFTSSAITAATEDLEYSYEITTTDVDVGDTRTIIASTIPTWLTFSDNGDGTASLTGTPFNADVGSHNVVLEVTDGVAPADAQSFTITVTNTNEPPIGIPAITGTPTEGQTLTADISGISDEDGLSNFSYQWLRDGEVIFGSINSTYTLVDADVGTQIRVAVTYTDGESTNEGPLTSISTAVIANANELPEITSSNGAPTALVFVWENQNTILRMTSSDQDGDTLSYSLVGGTDQALFSIEVDNGVLTFDRAMNFELPEDSDSNNHYNVIVQVDDGKGGTDTQAVTIAVTDVNEAPVVDSEDINGSIVDVGNGDTAVSISVDENQNWIIKIPAKDVDAGATQTYSVTGGEDQSAFSINSDTGDLYFIKAADHEEKEKFEVEVSITDNGGLTTVKNLLIKVRDVNESPMPLADNLETKENQKLVIDPATSLLRNDTDPEHDTLALVDITQPQNGMLTVNAQGFLVYEPDAQYVGKDRFDYVVEDAVGNRVSATVWLEINALNDPALAAATPDSIESSAAIVLTPQSSIAVPPSDNPDVISVYEQMTAGSSDEKTGNFEKSEEVGTTKENTISRTITVENAFPDLATSAKYERVTEQADQPSTTRANLIAISKLLKELLEQEITGLDITFNSSVSEKSSSKELHDAIVLLRDQIDQILDNQDVSSPLSTYAPVAIGATFSAGLVTWLFQSGLLVSATITATPLWRPLDPVAILANSDNDDNLFENDG